MLRQAQVMSLAFLGTIQFDMLNYIIYLATNFRTRQSFFFFNLSEK